MTHYYVRTGGSNLNSGTTNADAAAVTLTGGTWVQSTRVFTPAVASTAGLAVGDFCSIYPDGTTPDAVYISRITSIVTNVSVTLAANGLGTAPTDGTSNRTLKMGGAWQTAKFTFEFAAFAGTLGGAMNAAQENPQVNFAAGTFTVASPGINKANNGQCFYKGAGIDQTIIDGGNSGANYTLFTSGSSAGFEIADLTFYRNGATGTGVDGAISLGGTRQSLLRVRVTGMVGTGLAVGANALVAHCEFDGNNTSNTADRAGVRLSSGCGFYNNFVHHNLGSNTSGIIGGTSGCGLYRNIIASNGAHGAKINSASSVWTVAENDFFNNGGDGININSSGGAVFLMINNNFEGNVIGCSASSGSRAVITEINCRYYGNTTSPTNAQYDLLLRSEGRVTGAAVGYVNAATTGTPRAGDFTPATSDRKGTGYALFVQSATNYNVLTTSYPNIGAVQQQAGGGQLINRI